MSGRVVGYSERCEKNIRILSKRLGADAETAYAMILMTATLMDLRPEDDEVVRMILCDCGMEDGDIA